jgi:hypothetical protein
LGAVVFEGVDGVWLEVSPSSFAGSVSLEITNGFSSYRNIQMQALDFGFSM